MKKTLVLLTIISVILSSCANNNNNEKKNEKVDQTNNLEIHNDMENAHLVLPSWYLENTVVKMDNPKAFSGEYSICLNDTTEYGYKYKETLKNIDKRLPKTITYTAQIYSTTPNPEVSIICNFENNIEKTIWQSIPLKDKVTEANKWIKISDTYYLSNTEITPEMVLAIYAWNHGKEKIYIDDIAIKFNY